MKRAHRIALKPTPDQEALFSQHAGYARCAYNWALGEFKAGLDMGCVTVGSNLLSYDTS